MGPIFGGGEQCRQDLTGAAWDNPEHWVSSLLVAALAAAPTNPRELTKPRTGCVSVRQVYQVLGETGSKREAGSRKHEPESGEGEVQESGPGKRGPTGQGGSSITKTEIEKEETNNLHKAPSHAQGQSRTG